MTLQWLTRACGLAALFCFVVLAVLSKTQIEPGGMVIFDSRLAGYSLEDARAFVAALSADQRAAYLGPFRVIDTVFPVLLTAYLWRNIWVGTTGESAGMRTSALLGPALYLVFDLMENAQVATMVRADAVLDAALVGRTSTLTQAKWMCLALSLLVMFWAWRFARKERAV